MPRCDGVDFYTVELRYFGACSRRSIGGEVHFSRSFSFFFFSFVFSPLFGMGNDHPNDAFRRLICTFA